MTEKAIDKLLTGLPLHGNASAKELPSRHVHEAYALGLVSIVSDPSVAGSQISLTPEGIRRRRSIERNIQAPQNYGKAAQK